MKLGFSRQRCGNNRGRLSFINSCKQDINTGGGTGGESSLLSGTASSHPVQNLIRHVGRAPLCSGSAAGFCGGFFWWGSVLSVRLSCPETACTYCHQIFFPPLSAPPHGSEHNLYAALFVSGYELFFSDDLSTFCPVPLDATDGAAASHLLCLVHLPCVNTLFTC